MDARRAFLTELIDDAGLFPPASLSMDSATKQHLSSRSGPNAWMLGRFICPASRLEELEEHLDLLDRWRLSLLVDDPGRDLETAARFLQRAGDRVAMELVETRPGATTDVARLAAAVASAGLGEPALFLEVPPEAELDAWLDAVAAAGVGGKLRCGGTHVPTPERVAAFIDGCRRRDLRWKATAGLHHPFRHLDEGGAVQHGFVNLVGAAVLAEEHDLGVTDVTRIVEDSEPMHFELSPARVAWHDLSAGPEDVAEARRTRLFAFGSCSFDEPVEDLVGLGILPA